MHEIDKERDSRLSEGLEEAIHDLNRQPPKWLVPVLVVLFLAGMLAFSWVIPAYFEARTYNKVTGADVTWWDALWVEFRVQEDSDGR